MLVFTRRYSCKLKFKSSPPLQLQSYKSNNVGVTYTLRKKEFFNGSLELSKVRPGTFCYLNQTKGSSKYTRLWRTNIKRFFIFLWRTLKGFPSLHPWRTIQGSSRVTRWRTLSGSSLFYQESIMVLHNKRFNTINNRLLNFSSKHPSVV